MQAGFRGCILPFHCPLHSCGDLESVGKTVWSGRMLLRQWDLFIAMRVELVVGAKFDGSVKSHLLVVGGESKRESIPFAALYRDRERSPGDLWEVCYSFLQSPCPSQR